MNIFQIVRTEWPHLDFEGIVAQMVEDCPATLRTILQENPGLNKNTQALQPWMLAVINAIWANQYVNAIKEARTALGLGLKEAKDLVDDCTEKQYPYFGTDEARAKHVALMARLPKDFIEKMQKAYFDCSR